jgi:hypothetical protein
LGTKYIPFVPSRLSFLSELVDRRVAVVANALGGVEENLVEAAVRHAVLGAQLLLQGVELRIVDDAASLRLSFEEVLNDGLRVRVVLLQHHDALVLGLLRTQLVGGITERLGIALEEGLVVEAFGVRLPLVEDELLYVTAVLVELGVVGVHRRGVGEAFDLAVHDHVAVLPPLALRGVLRCARCAGRLTFFKVLLALLVEVLGQPRVERGEAVE